MALHDPSNRCPVCGTLFDVRVCSICGEPFEPWGRSMCRPCYRKYVNVGNGKAQRNRRKEVYSEWLEMIQQVPKDYPTLTEEQWMEAVQHFGGCALCGDESIDTRGFFVPFKSGGRYCDWNVIPLCSRCATRNKTNYNWFLETKRPVGLTDIVTYLEVRLNAAIKKS